MAIELSELRLSEFTAARDAYVAKARKAGDRPLAAAVAAWTADLLGPTAT
ncbi:hypothetical protein ACFXDJ_15285 [Streptomyces sp. NPDC059443]